MQPDARLSQSPQTASEGDFDSSERAESDYQMADPASVTPEESDYESEDDPDYDPECQSVAISLATNDGDWETPQFLSLSERYNPEEMEVFESDGNEEDGDYEDGDGDDDNCGCDHGKDPPDNDNDHRDGDKSDDESNDGDSNDEDFLCKVVIIMKNGRHSKKRVVNIDPGKKKTR